MLDPVDQPFLAVLQVQGRERGEPGADAPDRRALSEVPVLRLASDGPPARPGKPSGRPAPGAAHPEHRIYPYLLRDMTIDRPNQVWCADITYIPVRHGFMYLVAIMDWATRHVLAWWLSNTLDAAFCTDALDAALAKYGKPEIFNTDQGSQFTGDAFIGRLRAAEVRISMDGRGRWLDNVFIERLWRSLKYEAVYLRELADGFEAERVIDEWMAFYNAERPHSALAGGSLSRRGASGYGGQAASRLDHISTGATAAGRLKEMRILAA